MPWRLETDQQSGERFDGVGLNVDPGWWLVASTPRGLGWSHKNVVLSRRRVAPMKCGEVSSRRRLIRYISRTNSFRFGLALPLLPARMARSVTVSSATCDPAKSARSNVFAMDTCFPMFCSNSRGSVSN